MNGILNVLKPPGMTSHDVVNFVRRETGLKKVGHTGTLDPEAAGVLPICIGKATKAVQYITDKRKKYRANIKFGMTTETQDKYGNAISEKEVPYINIEFLQEIANKFIGKINQTPPQYSAVKYKGKKLYQYALEGQVVDVKSREIEIYDINIVDRLSKDEFMIDVLCSKGTYIRTLCNDIGQVSGYGAYMSQLIRLESYPFTIYDSFTLEEIQSARKEDYLNKLIINTDYVFSHCEKVSIKDTAKKSALNGNPIYSIGIMEDIEKLKTKTVVRLYVENSFLGLGETHFDDINNRNYIKIKTLFI